MEYYSAIKNNKLLIQQLKGISEILSWVKERLYTSFMTFMKTQNYSNGEQMLVAGGVRCRGRV